ncbi:ribonuclease HII [Chryseomicrobium sp. FSL W7-1435]|uniref:ribonuclease HII n=1 Tax=Chryseomicrobium sp. FSL W7-1435 TaxID=2921704 RepID=UPI00315AC270
MESIKMIKEKLRSLPVDKDWLKELRTDERLGVQKLLASFDRNNLKQQQKWTDYKARHDFDYSFGSGIVAGVDEAGRGPLAGPVVTAAVILPENTEMLSDVNDSKQLKKETRSQLAALIRQHAVSYSVHIQPRQQIDQFNIYEATKQSMVMALEGLAIKPDIILSDAMPLPVEQPCHALIKGDARSLSIAAASILAKTVRDAYMEELALQYPGYGFEQHAGYGTPAHLKAIEALGICSEHRRSFEPIKSLVNFI